MRDWRKEIALTNHALDDFMGALKEMGFPDRMKELMEDTCNLLETYDFIPKEEYLDIVERLEALAPLEDKARNALQNIGGDFGEFSLFVITCNVLDMLQQGTHEEPYYPLLSDYFLEENKEIEIFGSEDENEEPEVVLTNPGEIWDYLHNAYVNENK